MKNRQLTMNQDSPALSPNDCSSIQVEILIEESWIDRFLVEQQVIIPINDKTHLTNLKINLDSGMLNLQADFEEKEGSSIEITSRPMWDPLQQYLHIEDLKIQTKSKNLLFKSKGWFAQHFLNAKLDKKIEEQANLLYSKQLEKIKKDPVNLPIPKAGNVMVAVTNITIHELIFIDHGIKVKASIEGLWKLNLRADAPQSNIY